jgi:hypothetical protein
MGLSGCAVSCFCVIPCPQCEPKGALMRGAVMYGPGDVRVEERDEPRILEQ